MLLPFNIAKLAFAFLSKKFTFVLTSVPGPREGFQFDDMHAKSISGLMPPGAGENHMGIGIFSCDKIISLVLLCD
jgi:hypothetical protein